MVRLSVEKSCGKLPVRTVRNLIPVPVHVFLIFFRIFQIIVDGFPIRSGHGCHIQCRLHSSLNLIAVDSRVQQIRNMFNHAKILGVKDVSSSLVFIYRQVLSRTGLFHDRIFPPARMGAGTLVGISSCKIVWQQASSWIRDAHRSVNKGLDLHLLRNMLPDFPDFFQGQLSCRHNALCALLVPELIRSVVRIVCLSTDMPLDFRADLHGDAVHARIGDDERVRPDLF